MYELARSVKWALAITAMAASMAWPAMARQNPVDLLTNPNKLEFSDVRVNRYDFSATFKRDGRLVPPAQILQVVSGISALQVRELLGEPVETGHGSRGPEWDYNLKLDLADEDYIVCQYKVVFEENAEIVRETVWRRYQCKLALDMAAMQLTPQEQPQVLQISEDFLFDFDDGDLLPAGTQVLDRLARAIVQAGPSTVQVVGHTDRLGSQAYNQTLSERRARAVADYLIERGVPSDSIHIYGRGSDEPVKECEGTRATPELRECLHPNRRVTITVTTAS